MGLAGGAPGLNAILETDIRGSNTVVMSNYDPPSAETVGREIRQTLLRVVR